MKIFSLWAIIQIEPMFLAEIKSPEAITVHSDTIITSNFTNVFHIVVAYKVDGYVSSG